MGTLENRLTEAVLTCTHNPCFEQKLEKYHNFYLKIIIFTAVEKLQFITYACVRNVKTAQCMQFVARPF